MQKYIETYIRKIKEACIDRGYFTHQGVLQGRKNFTAVHLF